MFGQIDFWFEFASTYSDLTAMRIGTVAKDAGIDVSWRPFLLRSYIQETGLGSISLAKDFMIGDTDLSVIVIIFMLVKINLGG